MNYVNYYRSWYSDSLDRQSLRVVTEPVEEQISLIQAREHLRLDTYGSPPAHPDDNMIEQVFIPAAREYCEVITARSMVSQEYEMGLGSFPHAGTVAFWRDGIAFPLGPVAMVSSITYIDSDGMAQVLPDTEYNVDYYTNAGYIYPAPGTYWPITQEVPNAVLIRFMAGYSAPSASPQDRQLPRRYRSAMLLMLAHLYENRSQTESGPMVPKEIDLGLHSLLAPDSLRNGFA